MDQFLVQLVLSAWCSQGALYASMAYSQMRKIVGLHNDNIKSVLRSAFSTDLNTRQQIEQADRHVKAFLHLCLSKRLCVFAQRSVDPHVICGRD